ncbi:N-acetylneuraminate lyase-like [Contarinia nasturtii]|uniref:N-acetylneuraminate lyase-like n=1 Tax=Contarinia nasturtii TaxID=265458 RepID=UPI0012D429F4|nr:N-acetylneuraminate lyase-like [Contarinia nasturtii]
MGKFYFKGFMCPTFTAFDENKQVVYDVIDEYCSYLKAKGVNGVLVNGTTGEGTCLRLDERKRLAEEWLKACRKYGMTMMVQIGGCDILGVYELAQHAEKIGVDCVLCLPDLFFKPKIEEDLVSYINGIVKYCPTRPFYYYHIPRMSGVDLNMPRFYDLIEKEVPTFCGIKYTCGDMEIGVQLIKEGRNILLGADTILWGAFSLGFDAAILTTLSICPEASCGIYKHFVNNNQEEGLKAQRKLNQRIASILAKGTGEWVENMKNEFNNINVGFSVGPVRKPTIICRRL